MSLIKRLVVILVLLLIIPSSVMAQACGDNQKCVGATLFDFCSDLADTPPHIVTNFKVRLHDATDNVYTDQTLYLVTTISNTRVYAGTFTDVDDTHIYSVRYHHGGEFMGLWSGYQKPPAEHYLNRGYHCLLYQRYAPLVMKQE